LQTRNPRQNEKDTQRQYQPEIIFLDLFRSKHVFFIKPSVKPQNTKVLLNLCRLPYYWAFQQANQLWCCMMLFFLLLVFDFRAKPVTARILAHGRSIDILGFLVYGSDRGHYVGQNARTISTKVLPTRPTNSESSMWGFF